MGLVDNKKNKERCQITCEIPVYICVLTSERVWKHLPLSAHALVRCYIDCVCDGLVADSQAEVSYGTHAVLLDQDIFRLEVTVSNARLTCGRTDNTSLYLHQDLSRNRTCLLNVNNFLSCSCCFHLFVSLRAAF